MDEQRTILFLERGLGYGYSIFNLHTGSNDAVSYCQKRYNNDSSSDWKGLSLKNLTPAFVVLAIGYLLALLAFFVEKIGFHAHFKLRNLFFTRHTAVELFRNWMIKRLKLKSRLLINSLKCFLSNVVII